MALLFLNFSGKLVRQDVHFVESLPHSVDHIFYIQAVVSINAGITLHW